MMTCFILIACNSDLSLRILGVTAKLHPESIEQYTIPVLLKELADEEHSLGKYQDVLEAIQSLGVHVNLFKIITDPLLKKLDFACSHEGLFLFVSATYTITRLIYSKR